MDLTIKIGKEYIAECPKCGKLIKTHVWCGSGAFSCDCAPGEIIHFDGVSEDELAQNHVRYMHLL